MADHRTYQRIYDAIIEGRISRDPATYEYVDSAGRLRVLDLAIYEMADQQWLRLDLDGSISITDKGRVKWEGSAASDRMVLPTFSDSGQVA
ncbi:hypothetical protein QQG74_09865 [Micromonospora sp. FIMYZ51]|uniref:hypothetical protein n=1 Tax=Micromonospora sp. FIMYZ51 TaxID=3051832 RepID=UPI00311EF49A